MSEVNLRTLLSEAAADVGLSAPAPEVAVRRARRRAALSLGLSALALVVVVVAAAPVISSITDLAQRPASGPVEWYPIDPSAMPMATVAAYGSVWTLEQSPLDEGMALHTDLVARDFEGGDVRFRIPLGEDIGGQWVQLRAGYGAIWALSPSRQELAKVDPATGRIMWRRSIAARAFDVGSGGVWAITFSGEAQKIGATTGRRVLDVVRVGDAPLSIAATWGAVWVVDDLDGTVRRIDPITEEVVAEIQTGMNLTGDIVADSHGAWTIACRAVDGSQDPGVRPDACDLVLLRIDPATNEVASMTSLAGPSAPTLTNADDGAFIESVDASGVWVVLSESACPRSAFAPCEGDVLLRYAHDGVTLLDRADGMVITDATSADGDLWIANVGETHEIVRWQP